MHSKNYIDINALSVHKVPQGSNLPFILNPADDCNPGFISKKSYIPFTQKMAKHTTY